MKRHFPVHSLLLFALIAVMNSCGSRQTPELIGPLKWIRMGMERREIISHLPLKGSRNTLTPGFIHIRGIKEPSYTEGGLTSMIFIFRKEDGKRLLNAAHLTYDADKTDEKTLIRLLSRRFGKPAGRIWKLKGGFTVDIQRGRGKMIKITFDTPG